MQLLLGIACLVLLFYIQNSKDAIRWIAQSLLVKGYNPRVLQALQNLSKVRSLS